MMEPQAGLLPSVLAESLLLARAFAAPEAAMCSWPAWAAICLAFPFQPAVLPNPSLISARCCKCFYGPNGCVVCRTSRRCNETHRRTSSPVPQCRSTSALLGAGVRRAAGQRPLVRDRPLTRQVDVLLLPVSEDKIQRIGMSRSQFSL